MHKVRPLKKEKEQEEEERGVTHEVRPLKKTMNKKKTEEGGCVKSATTTVEPSLLTGST